MCHAIFPFAQTILLTKFYCSESLVWFRTSSFCHLINPGPLGRYSAVVLSQRDCAAVVSQHQLVHWIQQLIDGVDELKALNLVLDGS